MRVKRASVKGAVVHEARRWERYWRDYGIRWVATLCGVDFTLSPLDGVRPLDGVLVTGKVTCKNCLRVKR